MLQQDFDLDVLSMVVHLIRLATTELKGFFFSHLIYSCSGLEFPCQQDQVDCLLTNYADVSDIIVYLLRIASDLIDGKLPTVIAFINHLIHY